MFKFLLFFYTFLDNSEVYQLTFQDVTTPSPDGMIFFHNYLMFFLILIGFFIFWLLLNVIFFSSKQSESAAENIIHSCILESVWTIFPAIILLFLAVPSFSLLYSLEECFDPSLTLKIIGHQWYWSYEYFDSFDFKKGQNMAFDYYMVDYKNLTKGTFRLLEVDNRIVLPTQTNIRLLITAEDVLQSWSVSSLGINIDACPGRISQTSLFLKRSGVYYGQCSEICGINHGFMPIVVEGISVDTFVKWITNKIETLVLFDSKSSEKLNNSSDDEWKSLFYIGLTFLLIAGTYYYFFSGPSGGETPPIPRLVYIGDLPTVVDGWETYTGGTRPVLPKSLASPESTLDISLEDWDLARDGMDGMSDIDYFDFFYKFARRVKKKKR